LSIVSFCPNKINCHDITEILLKVALNIIKPTKPTCLLLLFIGYFINTPARLKDVTYHMSILKYRCILTQFFLYSIDPYYYGPPAAWHCYIVAVNFIGGGNQSTRRKAPTVPAASHWQTLSHNVVSSTPRHERDLNSQR
jgi:hypothetical protein